jgi:hypothetical protein
MSNFLKTTKHPKTGKWETARWLDDYFGRRKYGVEFQDGTIVEANFQTNYPETSDREKPTNDWGWGESNKWGLEYCETCVQMTNHDDDGCLKCRTSLHSMSKVLNLSELSSKIASASIQKTDAMTAKYLEEVLRHITERGDKIEDYALVFVSNPMELIDNGLKVSMQYRVCRVDELQNLPIYGGENTAYRTGDGLRARFWRRVAFVRRYGDPVTIEQMNTFFDTNNSDWGRARGTEEWLTMNEDLMRYWEPVFEKHKEDEINA